MIAKRARMFSTAGVVFEQRSGAIEGKERLDFPPLNNAIQRWPDRSELNGPRFVHTQRVCRVVFCLSRMTASGRSLPVTKGHNRPIAALRAVYEASGDSL